MAGVIKKLARKRKKRLLVSFDWTEFRRFHTLMAAACIKGRAVPLLWASYPGVEAAAEPEQPGGAPPTPQGP